MATRTWRAHGESLNWLVILSSLIYRSGKGDSGEFVKISLRFLAIFTSYITLKWKSKLIWLCLQTIQYMAKNRVVQTETRELASLNRGKIKPGETDDWRNEQLYVPPLPPTNLRGCHIIRIQYDVFVSSLHIITQTYYHLLYTFTWLIHILGCIWQIATIGLMVDFYNNRWWNMTTDIIISCWWFLVDVVYLFKLDHISLMFIYMCVIYLEFVIQI